MLFEGRCFPALVSEGGAEEQLAGELDPGGNRSRSDGRSLCRSQQFDEGAGGSPVQQRRGAGRGVAGVPERVEPFRLGGEVVDPVADVVHPAGLRHVQRGAGDGLPDLDGERPAKGEDDVAFHLIGRPAASASVSFRTLAGRQRSPKTSPSSSLPFSRSGTAIPMCQMLPMMSSYPDGSSASRSVSPQQCARGPGAG